MKGCGRRSDRPNILVIMPDQLRADTLGCAGHPHVRTPNIDRIAGEGVRFEHYYTTSPICMPARSNCLAGLYCHNHGQWNNYGRLPAGTDTYMDRLRRAGYHTAHIGKSHLYVHAKGHHLDEEIPFMNSLGFNDVLENTGPWATASTDSIMTDRWKSKGILGLFREDYEKRRRHRSQTGREALWPSPMPEGETIDDFVGRNAVEYFEEYNKDDPFGVFVGFGGPHEPWDPPETWARKYEDIEPIPPLPHNRIPEYMPKAAKEYARAIAWRSFDDAEWRQIRRLYYAKISHIDQWIGRILDTLERRGMLDNTFILFWSDHGERMCDRGGLFKSVFFEESCRVPLIVRHPDGRGAGSVAQGLCETTDIMPTILDAAGLTHDDCLGASLMPMMEDVSARVRREAISEIRHPNKRVTMLRTEQHKLVIDEDGNTLQLFDMKNDPLETVNLAGETSSRNLDNELRERLLGVRLRTDTERR